MTASLAYLFGSASPCHGLGSRTSFDRGLRRIGGRVFHAIVNSARRESGALIILRGFRWPGCPGCHGRSRAIAKAITLLLVVYHCLTTVHSSVLSVLVLGTVSSSAGSGVALLIETAVAVSLVSMVASVATGEWREMAGSSASFVSASDAI